MDGDGEGEERSRRTLLLGQFLPQSCQLCPQLSGGDQPSLLPIDHGQRSQDLLLGLLLLHLPVHDVEEGGEVQLCMPNGPPEAPLFLIRLIFGGFISALRKSLTAIQSHLLIIGKYCQVFERHTGYSELPGLFPFL